MRRSRAGESGDGLSRQAPQSNKPRARRRPTRSWRSPWLSGSHHPYLHRVFGDSEMKPGTTKPSNRPIEPMRFYDGTPCFPWPGFRNRDGYAKVSMRGKCFSVHRLVYENVKGKIPHGLTIDHLCRNRHCINPDHMEAVTARENTLRGNCPAALNKRRSHCLHGHPLFGDNLILDKDDQRGCKKCQRESRREHAARHRARLKDLGLPTTAKKCSPGHIGRPCLIGHIGERYASGACKECQRIRNRRVRQSSFLNPEHKDSSHA